MSNARPPRPPRPGGAARPGAPRRPQGPQGAAPQGGAFGDTRTVILSRKTMGMSQTEKNDDAPAAAAAPAALPKASVIDNQVHCVSCKASFPIVSDEFYGATVECPDCSAEFIIPTQAELASSAPAAAPAPAPAPAPARTPAPAAAAAPAPAAAPAKNRKPVKNVPDYIADELDNDEDVYVLKKGSLGNKAVVPAVVAAIGGFAGPFVPGVAGIAVGCGLAAVGIVLAFVLGGGGEAGLAVTGKRAIVKAGSFSSSAKLD